MMKDSYIRKKSYRCASLWLCLMLAGMTLAGCAQEKQQNEVKVETAGDTAEVSDSGEAAEISGTSEPKVADKESEVPDRAAANAGSVLEDGTYTADVVLEGGSGKASVDSPCKITVKDGKATAEICWSSSHYDFMIVDGEKYEPVNSEGNSQFVIPVGFDEEMAVQADTTAMSQPHLIDYTLTFTLADEASSDTPQPAAENVSDNAASSEITANSDASQMKTEGISEEEAEKSADTGSAEAVVRTAPEIDGLVFSSEMERKYAEDFSVFYYEDGYKVLAAASGRQYLLVPEGADVPEDLPEGMIVLQAPLKNIYLAASSAMALFHAVDALNVIAFSGTEAEDWYIEDASKAMEAGDIAFAGKYSQPDYEGLLAGGCDLAVESTMILHTPEVQEKLEALGIPVLIDESSHEAHPLGRTEWIRFYGALLGKEEEAEAFFEEQDQIMKKMEEEDKTGDTVAYFFVNSAGNVVVRRSDDYIPGMIELAGGTYVFQDLQNPNPESSSGSVTLSVEEFYAQAKDCDYLIYNAAIENPLTSIKDLTGKNPVFAEFKAVKEGHVYTTDKYMYQATDIMAELIRDMHKMMAGADDSEMTFLKHVGA